MYRVQRRRNVPARTAHHLCALLLLPPPATPAAAPLPAASSTSATGETSGSTCIEALGGPTSVSVSVSSPSRHGVELRSLRVSPSLVSMLPPIGRPQKGACHR